MLTLLLLIPILGSFFILTMEEDTDSSQVKMKNIALTTSLINLLISVWLWVQFDSSTNQFQFVYEFNKLSFCHFNVGVDSISIYFVLLTTFVTPFALLSNYTSIEKNLKYFLISFLLLETLQIALFIVIDLLLFYVFFESVLPILFIIILVYGSGENRIRSALLFFLYTLAGSLFMLLAVLQIYSNIGSTDFQIISLYEISLDSQKLLFLAFFLAFAVKTPLLPFHMWLPRAHADSPLAGSILLAATILKFASYGYLRVLINFLPDATNYFNPLIQTIAIITLIYASLVTIVQQDTKALIAYSSICHMAVLVLGLFSNTILGIEGAILLAIAHGFVSPALFISVGGVIYDRFHSRIVPYIRGLVTYMPVFTILFFIFTLANTGIPLSLNFLGEQLSLIGIWERNPIIASLGATGIVFSACYSIYLYNRLSYGVYSPHLHPAKDLSRREFNLLFSLLIPTVILGILPNVILSSLHLSVSSLLYNIPLNSELGETIFSLSLILIIKNFYNKKNMKLKTNFLLKQKNVNNNLTKLSSGLITSLPLKGLKGKAEFYLKNKINFYKNQIDTLLDNMLNLILKFSNKYNLLLKIYFFGFSFNNILFFLVLNCIFYFFSLFLNYIIFFINDLKNSNKESINKEPHIVKSDFTVLILFFGLATGIASAYKVYCYDDNSNLTNTPEKHWILANRFICTWGLAWFGHWWVGTSSLAGYMIAFGITTEQAALQNPITNHAAGYLSVSMNCFVNMLANGAHLGIWPFSPIPVVVPSPAMVNAANWLLTYFWG